MNSGDRDDQQPETDSATPEGQDEGTGDRQDPNRGVVSTTDLAVMGGPGADPSSRTRPDETVVTGTDRVRSPSSGHQYAPPAIADRAPSEPQAKAGPKDSKDPRPGPKHDPRPDPKHDDHPRRSRWIGLAITLAASLACGMAGAWGYNEFLGPKSKADDQSKDQKKGDDSAKSDDPSKADKTKPASESAEHKSTPMTGDDADSMKKQVQYLGSRFDALQQRVNSMSSPRDTNPPDFDALRMKVGELTQTIHDTVSNPDRSRQIEGRLDQMQGDFKRLSDQLGSLRSRVNAMPTTGAISEPPRQDNAPRFQPPPPPGPGNSAEAAPIDDAMAAGIAQFKKAQYLQADESFRQLRLTRPQDARVWYFSALSHGFATGQWEGETRRFVVHGADQERAGIPSSSQIDTAFADLSPAQGKEWLADYRSQLVKP